MTPTDSSSRLNPRPGNPCPPCRSQPTPCIRARYCHWERDVRAASGRLEILIDEMSFEDRLALYEREMRRLDNARLQGHEEALEFAEAITEAEADAARALGQRDAKGLAERILQALRPDGPKLFP